MPSHSRQNGSRNVNAPSRASSVKSDATLSSRAMPAPPSTDVHPLPAYVAASAAAELATDYHLDRIQDHDLHDDESFAEPNGAFFTEPALAIVNNFLDQLLYSFLASARSTSLSNLRPAVEQVLKGKLARQAIESADEELQELLGGAGEEDETTTMQGDDETVSKWDTIAVWKRTRLRIMVYTRLGELEDEDEERYVEEEGLDPGDDESRRTTPSPSLVSWSAAIFLTSVLEFIAEQCLAVAAQAAYDRADGQTTSRPSTRDGDEERVVIAEHDVERVALNSSLGRLWRTWRKSIRSSVRRSGLTSGSSSRRPSVSSNRLTMNSNRDCNSRSRSGTMASKTSAHDLLSTPVETGNLNEERKGSTDEPLDGKVPKDVAVKRVRSLLTFPEMATTSAILPQTEIGNVKSSHQRSYSSPAGEPTSMEIFLKRLAESKASIQARMTAKSEENVTAEAEDVPTAVQADTTGEEALALDERDLKTEKDATQKSETHFDDTASVTTFDDEHEQEIEAVLRGEDDKFVHEGVGEQPIIAQRVRVRSTPSAPLAVNVVNQQSSPPRTSSETKAVVVPDKVTPDNVDDTYEHPTSISKDSSTELSRSQLDELPEETSEEPPPVRTYDDTIVMGKNENIPIPPAKADVPPRSGKRRPKAIDVASVDIDPSMFPPTPKHAPVAGMTIPKSNEPTQQTQSSSWDTSQTPNSAASEYRRGSSASSKYSTAVGSLRTHNSGPDTTSPLVTKLSHDLPTPRSRAGSHALVDTREKDFDDLMNAEETVKYTLTPKNLRNLDQTNALGIKQANPSIARSEEPPNDFDYHQDGLPTPKQRTPRLASPASKAGSDWSGPSDISTAVIADASTLSVGSRKARRPPATNLNASKQGFVAREPRIQTESTRDFADFIRSTAPDGKTKQTQPILTTSGNTPFRSAVASPLMSRRGSLDVQYGPKAADLSNPPPVPTLKPKTSQHKFEARDPINMQRVDKDMIAFFKQGPPASGAIVSVQSARNDSTNAVRSDYSNSARGGNRESSTTLQSAPGSVNSQTGLLSTARPNGYRSGASDASSYNQPSKAPTGAPVRKQRRVKDPYAVDFSDEEDGDIVTELPPKKESLADFLNNYDPPPEDPTPPSRIVSRSTFGSRRGRKLGGKSASQPVSDYPPQIPADFASSRQAGLGRNGYSNGIPPPREEVKGTGMKGFLKKMSSAA